VRLRSSFVALLALTALVLGAAAVPAAGSAAAEPSGRSGRLLVTFRPKAPASLRAAAHRAADAHAARHLAAIDTDVVEVDDVEAALAEYRTRGDVVDVEEDGTVHALTAPPDNKYGNQWNLQPTGSGAGGGNQGTLDWEPVWPQFQGAGVLVAVVDTGLRKGNDAPVSVRDDIDYDFASEPDDTTADDENGHGTHIAGTIAQATGNVDATAAGCVPTPSNTCFSVAGVAPLASILPVKVLDRFGEGTVSDTAAGILYAAQQGAKVINLSLGGDYSRTLCDAVGVAARTALVVAASGNEAESGFTPVSYPGACPKALGIGALRWDGSRAPYSNAGCDLAATGPGGDLSASGRLFPRTGAGEDPRNGILQETFDPGRVGSPFGFFYDSGTSMAAAHAAGAAAVLLGINPDLATVRRAMLASTRDLGAAGPDDEYGAGALDLAKAVSLLQSGNVQTPAEALGYWMVATDGGIFSFGDAKFHGSTGAIKLNSPIVGMARTVTGRGYWLVAADGGIFAFGDARFYGSTGAIRLNSPIVGMAATGTGQGYWLVARDGGIFAFGDARFLGSAGGQRLNAPIVAMAADRTGNGYWLVGSDGGIFAYGDAGYFGSTGNLRLNKPIVGLTPTPTSDGYWMVATDGGIFAFGDAGFLGSTGNIALNKPIVGMAATCYGTGYWLIASDGGVFAFGNAPFLGSTGDIVLNKPMVGTALAIDHRSSQG
jgi:subtilisin family serine protease